MPVQNEQKQILVVPDESVDNADILEKARELGAIIIPQSEFSVHEFLKHTAPNEKMLFHPGPYVPDITYQYMGVKCDDRNLDRQLIMWANAQGIAPVLDENNKLDARATQIQCFNHHTRPDMQEPTTMVITPTIDDIRRPNEAERAKDNQLSEIQSASDIPEEKRRLIAIEFARLRKKYPKWKGHKIARRAGEKYGVKFNFHE